jgi:hypothetical protein
LHVHVADPDVLTLLAGHAKHCDAVALLYEPALHAMHGAPAGL